MCMGIGCFPKDSTEQNLTELTVYGFKSHGLFKFDHVCSLIPIKEIQGVMYPLIFWHKGKKVQEKNFKAIKIRLSPF